MYTFLITGFVLIVAIIGGLITMASGIRLNPWVIVPLFLFLKIAWPNKKRQPEIEEKPEEKPSSLDDDYLVVEPRNTRKNWVVEEDDE